MRPLKLAILYSGGKDSNLATWIANEEGYDISCLITLQSKNKDSFMFHTPSIKQTKAQAEAIGLPLIAEETEGEKEKELKDLGKAIRKAVELYDVEGIVTGAVESVYQASRIQEICDKLGIECFNPLWQKSQIEILEDLLKNKFEVIITGVAAYPLDESWLGKKIDKEFIKEVKKLNEKYEINPAGEGGEFETFVLNGPMFKHKLKVKNKKTSGEKNSWRMEIELGKEGLK